MGRDAHEFNLENCTLEELELSMGCTRTNEDFRRLQFISLLYRGYERDVVTEMMKVAESTVRKWIAAFNSRGIDGLVSRPRSGRPRSIPTKEFVSKYLPLIESPESHGFDFMTAVRLHGHLTEELRLEVSYSSVVRYLHEGGFCLKVPGKVHPDRNEEARTIFVDEMREILKKQE